MLVLDFVGDGKGLGRETCRYCGPTFFAIILITISATFIAPAIFLLVAIPVTSVALDTFALATVVRNMALLTTIPASGVVG